MRGILPLATEDLSTSLCRGAEAIDAITRSDASPTRPNDVSRRRTRSPQRVMLVPAFVILTCTDIAVVTSVCRCSLTACSTSSSPKFSRRTDSRLADPWPQTLISQPSLSDAARLGCLPAARWLTILIHPSRPFDRAYGAPSTWRSPARIRPSITEKSPRDLHPHLRHDHVLQLPPRTSPLVTSHTHRRHYTYLGIFIRFNVTKIINQQSFK